MRGCRCVPDLRHSRHRLHCLPLEPEKHFEKLTVLSVAPLIAEAIRAVFEDGSVTSLFDGRA